MSLKYVNLVSSFPLSFPISFGVPCLAVENSPGLVPSVRARQLSFVSCTTTYPAYVVIPSSLLFVPMDFYHGVEAHSYTLAQYANVDSDSDEESSWVMLGREGEIVKLPHEKIFYKVRSRIGLEVSSPRSIQNITPFSVKSDSGIVYITNERVCST